MKVLKFGGTSVGSAQRMKDVAKLITGERNIVVLSAMSGTTNSLVEISDYLYKKNPDGANEVINKLAQKYYGHIEELYSTDEYKQKAKELIKHHFDHIRTFTKDLFTLFEEKVVLAQGELISTGMMNLYLNECGINSVLIPALDYMRTDKNAEPDPVYIKEKLIKLLDGHKDADLFITQGYICRNAYGEIDNLQRGGSDYSASLIGADSNIFRRFSVLLFFVFGEIAVQWLYEPTVIVLHPIPVLRFRWQAYLKGLNYLRYEISPCLCRAEHSADRSLE